MEAVVFDAKTKTLTYQNNYPIPKIINDDDVIVKVEYSGVCGTDLHILMGDFPATKERPVVLGHESCGIVHEVGKKSIFKKDQKVVIDPNSACNLCDFCRKGKYQYCSTAGINNTIGIWQDGGWAHYVRAPQTQVYLLPDSVTTRQGGLCEPFSCVVHGLDRASPLKVGEKILIVGAGIIGNLWVTTLHHHGHREVTVSEMNKTRLDIVKKMDTGFRLISPDILAKEDILYDVIIDCTGVGKVMEINFEYLIDGGKYLRLIWMLSSDAPSHVSNIIDNNIMLYRLTPPIQISVTAKTKLNPFQIYKKELTIVGVKINPYTFIGAVGWLKAMGDRYLDYEKLGVKTYSLKDCQKAIDDLRGGVVAKAMFKI